MFQIKVIFLALVTTFAISAIADGTTSFAESLSAQSKQRAAASKHAEVYRYRPF